MQNKEFSNITVSVIMITYGHEKYIKQAIEGVLMQQSDFFVELIVANDCSPDDTDKVVSEIINNHPNSSIIKYTNHIVNRGANSNFLWAVKQAKGKYIALCEGDDYWTDPLKLQKQVDFLEGHPYFSFTFHNCDILNEKTGQKNLRIANRTIDEEPDLVSVIKENNIPTASLVFRKLDWNSIPEWFEEIKKGDYGLVVLLAEQGKGKYFNEPMCVYRIHDGGVWSTQNYEYTFVNDMIFYNHLLSYFKDKKVVQMIHKKMRYVKANKGLMLVRNGKIIQGLFQVFIFNNWFGQLFTIKIKRIGSTIKRGILTIFQKVKSFN